MIELEDDEILVGMVDNDYVVVKPIIRHDDVIGTGVYLIQGLEDNPTEYWIQEDDIDKYIELLQKSKKVMKYLYKQCQTCYFYVPREYECDLFEGEIDDFLPTDTCPRYESNDR